MEANLCKMVCLDGTNYHKWKGKMKDLLCIKNLYVAVFGTKSDDMSANDWTFENVKVCGFIGNG
jgi:hypothetical protein